MGPLEELQSTIRLTLTQRRLAQDQPRTRGALVTLHRPSRRSPGAFHVAGAQAAATQLLPPDGRIFRLNLASGKRDEVAGGFGFPWTVREGPAGHLLVVDQALGVVFDVDPATGLRIPLVQGLRSPSGLAFDRARDMVYVSDTGGGRILAVGISLGQPTVVADGLDGPEGIALHRDGSLLVVEGDAGRLVLIDPAGGRRQLIATALPTRTAGIGLPLLNYSSDVLVRSDGSIVVTGPSSGSLIELTR